MAGNKSYNLTVEYNPVTQSMDRRQDMPEGISYHAVSVIEDVDRFY